MSRGSFFSLPSEQVDEFLLSLRATIHRAEEQPLLVLLVVLEDDRPRRQQPTKSLQAFHKTCREVFVRTEGLIPCDGGRFHLQPVECAWYADRWKVIGAAAEIQQSLTLCEESPQSCSIAIARHELAAFRLARTAGNNQIVVDPALWPGLHVHAPDYARYEQSLEEIVRQVGDIIPWDGLPLRRQRDRQEVAAPTFR